MRVLDTLAKIVYGLFKKKSKKDKKVTDIPKDFLDSKGYNKSTDILIMHPASPMYRDYRVRGGKVIFLNVKAPAIIRTGYSGNRGNLW